MRQWVTLIVSKPENSRFILNPLHFSYLLVQRKGCIVQTNCHALTGGLHDKCSISQIWNRLNSSIHAPMIILFVLLVLYLPAKQHGVSFHLILSKKRDPRFRVDKTTTLNVVLFVGLFFVQPRVLFFSNNVIVLFSFLIWNFVSLSSLFFENGNCYLWDRKISRRHLSSY
jgi:hypothetical protein